MYYEINIWQNYWEDPSPLGPRPASYGPVRKTLIEKHFVRFFSIGSKNLLRFDIYSLINAIEFVLQAEVSECTKSNKNLSNMTIFEYLAENVALVGAKPKFFSGAIKAVVKLGPA